MSSLTVVLKLKSAVMKMHKRRIRNEDPSPQVGPVPKALRPHIDVLQI